MLGLLPDEMSVAALKYLDLRDLLRFAQTSSTSLARSNAVWYERYIVDLASDPAFQTLVNNQAYLSTRQQSVVKTWKTKNTTSMNSKRDAPLYYAEYYYTQFMKLWISFQHEWPDNRFEVYSFTLDPHTSLVRRLPFMVLDLKNKTVSSKRDVPYIANFYIENDDVSYVIHENKMEYISPDPVTLVDYDGDVYIQNPPDKTLSINTDTNVMIVHKSLKDEFYILVPPLSYRVTPWAREIHPTMIWKHIDKSGVVSNCITCKNVASHVCTDCNQYFCGDKLCLLLGSECQ